MAKGSGGGGGGGGVGGVGGRSARDKAEEDAFKALSSSKLPDNTKSIESDDSSEQAFAAKVSYSPDEQNAIRSYTGTYYEDMKYVDANGISDSKYSERVRAINRAFASAPKRESEVFRGLVVPREMLPQLAAQKELVFDSITSASRSTSTARSFIGKDLFTKKDNSGVLLCIKQKSGMHIETVSSMPTEKEILLRKGTAIRITSAKRSSMHGRPVLVLKGEEI